MDATMSLYNLVHERVSKLQGMKEVAKERMKTCQACKFYHHDTKTCGTPVFGNDVTFNKKKIHLCGCFIPLKSKTPWSQCPANKWKTEEIDFNIPIEPIIEALANYDKGVSRETVRAINVIYKESCGARCKDINVNDMHCGSCIANRIKDLRAYVKRVSKC
jgi:hypothetical protein